MILSVGENVAKLSYSVDGVENWYSLSGKQLGSIYQKFKCAFSLTQQFHTYKNYPTQVYKTKNDIYCNVPHESVKSGNNESILMRDWLTSHITKYFIAIEKNEFCGVLLSKNSSYRTACMGWSHWYYYIYIYLQSKAYNRNKKHFFSLTLEFLKFQ